MSERLRAYIGAEEIEVASASYTINNEAVVNTAQLQIVPESDVVIGAVVDVKKSDGSTTVFSGHIHTIEETTIYDTQLASNGYELINTWVEKVYTNTSPEDIAADIVDNFTTNLTYTGTATSGIVLEEYLAQGYAIDIIRDMLNVLRWRAIIDQNDNFDLDVEGAVDNGKVYTNGSNIDITSWNTTDENVINKVRLEAGFLLPRAIETFVATDTIFELEHKPESSVRAVVSGTEVNPDDYKVEPENVPPRIVFNSSVTNPTIEYTWRKRIIVEDQDESSIVSYGERFQRIDAPYIIAETDALLYARSIIDEYKDEEVFAVGTLPNLDFSVTVNELVTIVDPLRSGKTIQGVVSEIQYNYDTGQTIISVGPRDFDLVNWQNGVQDRIKQIERRFSSTDQKTFVRSISPKVQIQVEWDNETPVRYTPKNSLIADHITLGYARVDENMEVDCSPANSRHGTWSGTTIDGDQYVATGYRLYCADAAGTDEYCSYTGSISGVRSVSVFIKDFTNSRGLVTLTASASISIDGSGNVSTTGLTGVTTTQETVSGWTYINVNFDAVTVNLLEVGRVSTSYFNGLIDEFCLFDKILDAADRTQIQEKRLDKDTTLYEDHCLVYWAFDHPLAGNFEEEL